MLISAKDLLLKSIDLYRKHLGRYLTYSALMAIPAILLSIAGASVGILMVVTKSFFTGLIIFVVFAIIFSLLGFLLSLAFLRTVADDYMSKPMVSIMNAAKQAVPMIIPAILVSILTSLAIFCGMILLFIPGIIFIIWFTFSLHALILDDKHSVDALKYSRSLVSGRWFGVTWRLVAPLLIVYIGIVLIQWIFAGILDIQTDTAFTFSIPQIIYLAITTILSVIMTPLTVSIPTILYLELKKTPLMNKIEPDIPENIEATPAE